MQTIQSITPSMILSKPIAIEAANSYAQRGLSAFCAIELPDGGYTVVRSGLADAVPGLVVHTAEPTTKCSAYQCNAFARHDSGLCSYHHELIVHAR